MSATYYLSFFSLLQIILPASLLLILLVFGIKSIKKLEKRADERLEIDRKNTLNQQKQLDELTNKITSIEKILKNID